MDLCAYNEEVLFLLQNFKRAIKKARKIGPFLSAMGWQIRECDPDWRLPFQLESGLRD